MSEVHLKFTVEDSARISTLQTNLGLSSAEEVLIWALRFGHQMFKGIKVNKARLCTEAIIFVPAAPSEEVPVVNPGSAPMNIPSVPVLNPGPGRMEPIETPFGHLRTDIDFGLGDLGGTGMESLK